MPRRALYAALALLLATALFGCGYGFTGSAPAEKAGGTNSRLPMGLRKMALIRVDNPSTEAWLEARLRSLLRDEFNRRRLVVWTDREKAESHLTVVIKKYTRETALAGQQDQSVKLSCGITISLRVTRASDGQLIWDSGEQQQSESFYPGDSEGADMRLTDMAVRRLAEIMTQNY